MPNVTQSNHLASAALAQQPQAQKVQSTDNTQLAQQLALKDGESIQLTPYTVKKGDTLWDIAGVKLGNPTQWPILFALNREQIKNPDLIFPGQVLTVPEKVEVAPVQEQAQITSPLEEDYGEPVIFTPEPETVEVQAEPEIQTEAPVVEQQAPEPAPVAELPPAPEVQVEAPEQVAAPQADDLHMIPARPTVPQNPADIVLRHPSELPQQLPRLDPLQSAQPEQPIQEPELPVDEPEQPTQEPAQELPQEQPQAPEPTPYFQPVVGLTPSGEAQGSGVGKAAIIGGVVGTVGTGAALVGITAKIGSNLGGYATAQVVAKGLNSVTTKVGLKIPTGPALSSIIKRVGGPKVAGSVAAVGTGLAVAGLAAGGYYLYNKLTAPAEPSQTQPQLPPQSQAPQIPNSGSAADMLGQLQGAAQTPQQTNEQAVEQAPQLPTEAPTANTQGTKFEELNQLLGQKQYILFGQPANTEAVNQKSVQIWLDGNLQDRLKLSQSLVDAGQADLLGRIMNHSETDPVEVAQLMTQGEFPVSEFMKGLSDNRSFLILNSLATVALTGEPQSAGVILQTVEAYDGFRDREAPFKQLRDYHQDQGTWNQLPGSVQRRVNDLLK